jgi:uncharacterized UBP type Zn finger protein
LLSKPCNGKKRTNGNEHRVFQEKWELAYFCCEIRGKITCLICDQNIRIPKECNIKRHYETHRTECDQYKEQFREYKLRKFKSARNKQQSMFTTVQKDSEAAVNAAYVIVQLLARNAKCFSESEFVRQCLVYTVEIMCPDKGKLPIPFLCRGTLSPRDLMKWLII